MNKSLALLASLGSLFLVLHSRAVIAGNVSDTQSVYNRARLIVDRYNLNADPVMIAAMAKIESSYNPNAVRVETHINDVSIGLMQTLVSTAQWLARDFPKYSAKGIPSDQDLLDPETSLYFGAAYIDYLSRWRGVPRDEGWIVESYNGGPNNSNAQTRNHYRKYLRAKEEIIEELF